MTAEKDKACDIISMKPDVFFADSRETPTFDNPNLFKN
jgi:hypothetical protein